MKVLRHFAAAAIISITLAGTAQTSSTVEANPQQQMAERRQFTQEMMKMRHVISVNDTVSTPGTEFRPGATSPEYFDKSAAPMLKQAQVSDDQIKKFAKVNGELWELRVHDQDATATEVAKKVKALLKEQQAILTPEQHHAVMEFVKQRAMEMRSQARTAMQTPGSQLK